MRSLIAIVVTFSLAVAGCATTMPSHAKPGFYTEVKDGRLWVFREGSKDLETFKQYGEPAHQVTRVNAAPGGLTIRSSDATTIDDYLSAK